MRYTQETGAESGYSYLLDVNGQRPHWTPVFRGGQEGISREHLDGWRAERGLDDVNIDLAYLFDLHLHGGASGDSLDLSMEDLHLVDQDLAPHVVRPIVAVGMAGDAGYIHLLLMQKTVSAEIQDACPSVFEQAFEQYLAAERLWPNKKVSRSLEMPGYLRAGTITFRCDDREAKPVDLDDLVRFS